MVAASDSPSGLALGSEPTFSQVPFDPFTPCYVKTPSSLQFRFLDKHPLFQRRSKQSPLSPRSPSNWNLSQETLRPLDAEPDLCTTQSGAGHVATIITQNDTRSSLTWRPPSPVSPKTVSRTSPVLILDCEKEKNLPAKPPTRRRYIPIEIPAFANPLGLGQFPPTPSASADSTPRASFKTIHSCAQFIEDMSGPLVGGSRASVLDANMSALSPQQSHDEQSRPPQNSYLADVNSSSESSLNQAVQEVPNHDEQTNGPRTSEVGPTLAADSPAVGSQTPATVNGTTNLSGLVCNVHKCTGKEPHGLVGATTTILGDKLYVLGGRILSRRRPYLSSDLYELDLIRRHWTKLQTIGDVPTPRYFHSVCALGDTKLICYGGMSPAPSQVPNGNPHEAADPNGEMAVMSDIHVYDTPTKKWTHITTSDTPPGRYAHCAAVLPSTSAFTSTNAPLSAILHNPPSSVPNQGTIGVAIDGTGGAEMIVVGGQDSNNKYIDAISVFNLRSLTWTDTHSLPRSCGAYRSVVTPLVGLPPMRIGKGTEHEDHSEGANGIIDKSEPTTSMLIYSNYNFLDVKLELQVRMPNGTLVERAMKGAISPPGLRFPNGDVLDNHFIVSGTYLTSSKHEYALWALDLKTLEWSRIDAGGGIFSQGSWNRGVLWARRNTFVILGNRKRSLVDDYNHRRINFSNMCMVELEAFGLFENPRRVHPASNYSSISSPILPPSVACKTTSSGGRALSSAAVDLGAMAMNIRDLADMDLLAVGGERIPVNSYVLARRWGPYFVRLLRETGGPTTMIQNDASSSSDGGTLRPYNLTATASLASRNSSITITPSITTAHSVAPSGTTAVSNNSGSTIAASTTLDPATPQNLPATSRPRQLYLPHTLLTLRALVHYLYTSSLPSPKHHLCTPQILCSLLQLARPYRIDGLLEATVERLHQILDGRNAAAVFNAAAMAAGGGRGTGTAFGKEGDSDLLEESQSGLTMTRLQANNARIRDEATTTAAATASESGTDTSSEASIATSVSTRSEDSNIAADGKKFVGGTEGEIWTGGASCVVGLQKRGLRGLMEGRRTREKERGRTVGGLESPSQSHTNVTGASLAGGTNGVGLGIAGG